MVKIFMLTSVSLVLAMAPALAATHFYVARTPHTKRCDVVEKAPDGKNLLVVGSAHTSKSAAIKAMHTSVSCTSTKKGSKY